MKTVLLALVLLLASSRVSAQNVSAADQATAPSEAREVVATGTAAIGTGGVLAARRSAQAQALRNAVEKTTGVFVSAQTLTRNYVLLRDQVTTRAEGFAVLKDVLGEVVGPESVTVRVRALVSLRPLAERLKGLGLTRAWRISVGGEGAATATLERTLTDAGFVVIRGREEADVFVRVEPHLVTTAALPLETAAGPMTMYSVSGPVTVRATRAGTGEVVAALSATGAEMNVSLANARGTATGKAMEALAPRLADALMLLPARNAQPVQLVVSHVESVTQAGRLEEALALLPGVQDVVRRSFGANRAVWELSVFADSVPLLSRRLESDDAVRSYHLTVASDAGAKIVASAGPAGKHR